MPARSGRSVWIVAGGLIIAVILSVGYSTWAIDYHGRQACTELRILATTGGATTHYDKAVRAAYARLYALRCT